MKIKLDGDLRIMEIASPPRFDALVKAVAEAYVIPSRSESQLTFTYRDSDGDEVCSLYSTYCAYTIICTLTEKLSSLDHCSV